MNHEQESAGELIVTAADTTTVSASPVAYRLAKLGTLYVLQGAFEVTRHRKGSLGTVEIEWRNLPTVLL